MTKKDILTAQIFRLARIYTTRPVKKENFKWHDRILKLQVNAIKEKRKIV